MTSAPAHISHPETTPRTHGAGDWAMRVRGVGKWYPLTTLQKGSNDNLRAAVMGIARSMMRRGASKGPKGNGFWALKDISLDINQGDTIGVVGRNGAGKSTFFKLLSRITAPTEGTIRYRGRLASLLEVGTGFHRELSGRENIFLNGAILGMSRREIQKQFDAIVDFAGVEKFLDTPVKFYSSGMYVRLAFAVAAHLRTEILIVDEVLAVGDAEFQKKCLGKMQGVASDGRTVLFVSHNMGSVRRLCQRGVMLERGELVTAGSVDHVIDTYLRTLQESGGAEAIFPDDPSKLVQYRSIRILNGQGQPCSVSTPGQPLQVELCWVIRESVRGVNLTILLQRNGMEFLSSYDTDLRPELMEERKPGAYRALIPIDTSIFKPGVFTVRLVTGFMGRGPIEVLHDVVSFTLEAGDTDDREKSYAEHRPGVLRMPLRWEITSQEKALRS